MQHTSDTHIHTHTHADALTHSRTHAPTHLCTHAPTHPPTHARTHTHTHTHTRTHAYPTQVLAFPPVGHIPAGFRAERQRSISLAGMESAVRWRSRDSKKTQAAPLCKVYLQWRRRRSSLTDTSSSPTLPPHHVSSPLLFTHIRALITPPFHPIRPFRRRSRHQRSSSGCMRCEPSSARMIDYKACWQARPSYFHLAWLSPLPDCPTD